MDSSLILRPDDGETQQKQLETLTLAAHTALFNAYTLLQQGAEPEQIEVALIALDEGIAQLKGFSQASLTLVAGLGGMVSELTAQRDEVIGELIRTQNNFDESLSYELDQCLAEAVTERIDYFMQDDPWLDEQRTDYLARRIKEEGYEAVEADELRATESRLREAREQADAGEYDDEYDD